MKTMLALFLLLFSASSFAQSAPQSVTPAPDSHAAVTPMRVIIMGNVMSARAIERVPPIYPSLARQTHIQGTVRLHAIIATDGSMKSVEVMSGHPLLVQAALDAVRKWRYQPTLLNGAPVEVDTTVDVIFIPERKSPRAVAPARRGGPAR